MSVLSHTWYMTVRQARNLMREPIWIVLLLVQPMVWLVLYGQLFKNVTRLGGFGTGSYVTFLAPAIVVMNAFFGATWSGMSMIADLDRKVVERFLATPASRFSIVLSQIVRSAITAAIQALIILLVALATRKEATMIAIANFIGLPLLFLSSTLLAQAQMPHWMRVVSRFNPVNWGVKAARDVVLPGTDWGSVGMYLLFLVALSAATAALATWTFRAYQRSL